MKYLIDTHIFLWSLFSQEKISRHAAKAIKESGFLDPTDILNIIMFTGHTQIPSYH